MSDHVPWLAWYLYGTGATAVLIETGHTPTEAVITMTVTGVAWAVADCLLDKAIERWSV